MTDEHGITRWQVGDVVQLKSGSPLMTVESTNYHGMVVCVWYDIPTQRYRREQFPNASLTEGSNVCG